MCARVRRRGWVGRELEGEGSVLSAEQVRFRLIQAYT